MRHPHQLTLASWVAFCIGATALALLGCASTVPEAKYMPQAGPGISPFFANGQPIACVEDSSMFMLTALEPALIGENAYIRLWLMYQNKSDSPYLLEPLKLATLSTIRVTDGKGQPVAPTSPTTILAKLSNEEAARIIGQVIGGALQAAATEPTRVRTTTSSVGGVSSSTSTFNDVAEKQQAIADRTSANVTATETWYSLYRSSLNEGILRRNTVFPGQSVNGFIFFPLATGVLGWRENYESFVRSHKYKQTVALHLQSGQKILEFMPIEGE